MATKRQKKKKAKQIQKPSYKGYKSTNKYDKRDAKKMKKLQEDIEYQHRFSQGYMTYEEILTRIDNIRLHSDGAGNMLDSILNSIIDTDGIEGLVNRISGAEDKLLEELDLVLLYVSKGDNRWSRHVASFMKILTGKALTAEQARAIADSADGMDEMPEV